MKAKSAKAKGSRLEKWVVDALRGLGISARKQPGSGVFQSFPHDVFAEVPGVGRVIVECKSWKNGWRTGDKALGQADLLVIKRDYGEPCVYMTFKTFEQFVAAAKEGAK